jgi:hypothetical protein
MTEHSTTGAWQPLGRVSSTELVEPRLQLHRAAQVASGFGATYVEHADDFSHTSLEWLGAERVLAGQPTQSNPPLRLTLDLGGFALGLLAQEAEVGRFTLDGHSLDDAYAWVEQTMCTVFGSDVVKRLERPDVPTPPGPGLDGTPFALAPSEAFVELSRWFGDAALVLQAVASKEPTASPVRCWPHHFDIAVLIPVDVGEPGETARSIGVGMTPGDDSYPEPYWYVLPWPQPDGTPPPLPVGSWHTEGWYGAVLTARDVVGPRDGDRQHSTVEEFVRHSIAASRRLLGERI